jgi:tetratricopeptide (TPR) repeat protein
MTRAEMRCLLNQPCFWICWPTARKSVALLLDRPALAAPRVPGPFSGLNSSPLSGNNLLWSQPFGPALVPVQLFASGVSYGPACLLEGLPQALFGFVSDREAGDLGTAENLYRRVMKLDPKDPAAGLNLGNLLRNEQRTVEAEAAFRWAVKADPNFAPAWHNLADLLDETGRLAEAADCERRALTADPEYADAMFNMALYLQRLGNHREAATWWTRYLERDRTSAWAERAKRALKYCEMEIANAASKAASQAPAQATGQT